MGRRNDAPERAVARIPEVSEAVCHPVTCVAGDDCEATDVGIAFRYMAKPHELQQSICVLASHPMVLRQLQELLTKANIPATTQVLGLPFTPIAQNLQVPSTDVYIVDCELRAAEEAFVGWLKGRHPSAQIVVVANALSEATVFPLLRLGVKGLVTHEQVAEDLVRAVTTVASGGYWVPRTLLSHFVDSVLKKTKPQLPSGSVDGLTRRQKEVLDSLIANLSNKEIATALNISERTVKFHVSILLEKFGVRRRADLILICYQDSQLRTFLDSRPTGQTAGVH